MASQTIINAVSAWKFNPEPSDAVNISLYFAKVPDDDNDKEIGKV